MIHGQKDQEVKAVFYDAKISKSEALSLTPIYK